MDKLQFCNHETVDEGGVENCENFCVAYSLKMVATCQLRLCPLTWDPNELERVIIPRRSFVVLFHLDNRANYPHAINFVTPRSGTSGVLNWQLTQLSIGITGN